MKPYFIFGLLFLLGSISGFSQEINYLDVHPIRVNHKWGYVKIYPTLVDTIIPPKYDFLGDINMPYNKALNNGEASPYRLFELEEKVGLLNTALEEVVPNRYNRIKVVSDDFFAVTDKEQYYLIDRKGQVYFDSTRFENICLAEGGTLDQTNYFFTKTKGRWGISRVPNDETIVPASYTLIENAGQAGFYKVQVESKGFWGLIDSTNRQLLAAEFEDVLVLDEQHFAVEKEGRWLMYTQKNGQSIPSDTEYKYIEKINQSLALLVPWSGKKSKEGKEKLISQIWNFAEDKIIHTFRALSYQQYDLCKGLNDRYAIKYGSGGFNLINAIGETVSIKFHEIAPTNIADVYKVRFQNRFGLIQQVAIDSFISTGYKFDSIYDIKNDMAIVTLDGRYGMLGIAADTFPRLDCVYTNIPQIDTSNILLQFGEKMLSYQYTPTDYFVPNPIIYEDALLIPSDPNRRLRESIPIKMTRYPKHQPKMSNYFVLSDSIYTTDSLQTTWGRWYTKDRGVALVHCNALPIKQEEVLNNFYGVHTTELIPLQRSYLSFLAKGSAREYQLFDLVNGRAIATPKMVGLRTFNEETNVSCFIDPSGKMGLIDKSGKELVKDGQPIRYTYIGPFVAGRARVCKGGKITFDTRKELAMPPKFRMGNMAQLIEEFRIKPKERPKSRIAATDFFIIDTPDNPAQWSYIDPKGNVLFEAPFDYVQDFHWRDSTALVLKKIDKEVYIGSGKKEAVYGLIDFYGNTKIEPQYNLLTIYKDFYLINRRNTPTFTFDQRGKELLINPTKPTGFYEGLSHFKNEQRLSAYISETGTIVIPPMYQYGRAFSSGLALVADTTGQLLFINPKGNIRISLKVKKPQLISDFKEGYTWVKKVGNNWQCLDTTGKVAFEQMAFYQPIEANATDSSYFVPMSFSNGLAIITTLDTNTNQLVSAIINTKGQIIKQFHKQQTIGAFNEKGQAVFEEEAKKGIIDSLGQIVIPSIYTQLIATSNGFWKIQLPTGKWGVLDDLGNTFIPPIYIRIGDLSAPLVAVKKEKQDQWNYIDHKGQLVLPGPYYTASAFKNGYAFVTQGEKNFVINEQGEELIFDNHEALFYAEQLFGLENKHEKTQYFSDAAGSNIFGRFFQEITPHQLGIAKVKRIPLEKGKRELYGAINTRGVMIVPPKFSYLHIQADGHIIMNPQRYFGILDKQGKVLIEPEYDKIEQFLEFDIFRVERGESVGYVRLKDGVGKWVWKLQK